MKHNNTLEILDVIIPPGTRQEILFPMPKLYDGSPLYSHLHVLNGANPGPTLCLTGAIHGRLKNLKNLNGAIIAAPIVNIYGFLYQKRYLMDRRDLNRSFPGTKKGSLASRTANLFFTEIFKKSDYLIDFHTGSQHRSNLPQIRANFGHKNIRNLAEAFGAPVTLKSEIRPGSLRELGFINKIPVLVYEAGEAMRIDPVSVKFGVQGVFNLINYLGINTSIKYKQSNMPTLFCETSAWVRAKASGMFNTSKKLGNIIKTGDKLGFIVNPMTLKEEKVITPISGIIIGINNNPLVHEGGALFNIASMEKLSKKQLTVMEMLNNDEVESLLDFTN